MSMLTPRSRHSPFLRAGTKLSQVYTGDERTGEWVHVCWTFGTTVILYLDGQDTSTEGNTNPGSGSLTTIAPAYIGRRADANPGPAYMQGDICDVRAYRGVLSPADIVQIMGEA